MICLDRDGKKSSCKNTHRMAPNFQSYFASCLQRCSFIWDSIWNPFDAGKSEKLHLMANGKNGNAYDIDDPYLSYGMKLYDKLYENSMPTEAVLIDMLGPTRPSFMSEYKAFNFVTLPVDFKYNCLRGSYGNRNMMSTLLKQPLIAKSMLDRCDFHLPNVEPLDKPMAECKVEEMTRECAPNEALPVKTLDSPQRKQHRRTAASVTVSVVRIQRNAEILNQELVNRKNRELKKCSKKRRRRQKKQNNKCDSDVSSTNYSKKCVSKNSSSSKVDERAAKSLPVNIETNVSMDNQDIVPQAAELSSQNCSNPLISFIMGHFSETESDSETDFCSENDRADIELCFTNTLNAVTVGLRSVSMSPEDSKHSRADCTISIVSFTDISPEVIDANKRWNQSMADIKPKLGHVTKVAFRHDSELTTIFPVEVYDRRGEWERFALERFRFKRRIDEAERLLSPILAASHRENIFRKLDFV